MTASRGYVAEAESINASSIETLALMMSLLADSGEASKWLEYPNEVERAANNQMGLKGKNPNRPFQGRVKMMKTFWDIINSTGSGSLSEQKIEDNTNRALKFIDRLYNIACDHKHIDPETQRNLNVVSDDPKKYGAGPDFSEYGRTVCFRALYTAAILTQFAMGVYGKLLAPSEAKDLIGGHIASRQTTIDAIRTKAETTFSSSLTP